MPFDLTLFCLLSPDIEDLLKSGENIDLSAIALTPPSSDHCSPMSSPPQSDDSSAPNSPSFDEMEGKFIAD